MRQVAYAVDENSKLDFDSEYKRITESEFFNDPTSINLYYVREIDDAVINSRPRSVAGFAPIGEKNVFISDFGICSYGLPVSK